MPPVTAAARSAPVEVMTREVNVEALNPWSIVNIWYCSTARATSGSGRSQSIGRESTTTPPDTLMPRYYVYSSFLKVSILRR